VLDRLPPLEARDFYRPSHGRIYTVCRDLHADGQGVDIITVCHELDRRGWLEDVGGKTRVAELAHIVPAAANAPYYAAIVRERAAQRRVLSALKQLATDWDADKARIELQAAADMLAEPAARSSWQPIDLVEHGAQPVPPPQLCHGLIYEGRAHLWSGEPDAGKSWLSLVAVKDVAERGRAALIIDVEDGPGETLSRLRALDIPDDTIREHVIYVRPEAELAPQRKQIERTLTEREPGLVVCNAFTGLLAIERCDPNVGADIERWYATVGRVLQSHGAALLIIDHVVKQRDDRGKWAIGSERKVAGCDVHVGVAVKQSLKRGETGILILRTHKDRHGHLQRPIAAEVVLRSSEAWQMECVITPGKPYDAWQPTHVMADIARYLETAGASSQRMIEANTKAKATTVRQALRALVDGGYVAIEPGGRGGGQRYKLVMPFSEQEGQEDFDADIPF
jgi:hypothetical protein